MLRDMGSEMTPLVNQEPLKPAPLVRDAIPSGTTSLVRSGSYVGLTVAPGEKDDTGETTKFGRENEETNSENVVENNDLRQDLMTNPLEKRAMAWDEAESTKYMARLIFYHNRFNVFILKRLCNLRFESDYLIIKAIKIRVCFNVDWKVQATRGEDTSLGES